MSRTRMWKVLALSVGLGMALAGCQIPFQPACMDRDCPRIPINR